MLGFHRGPILSCGLPWGCGISVFTGLGVLQWLLGLHACCLPADEAQDCQDDEWVPSVEEHSAIPG